MREGKESLVVRELIGVYNQNCMYVSTTALIISLLSTHKEH